MKRFFPLVGVMLLMGCQSAAPPPVAPSLPVAPKSMQTFTDSDAGISFQYPSDWKIVSQKKTELKLAAPSGEQFTLDVPVLPFHIPGMIPVDQVESGYVADFKKRMPDATATPQPDPTVPDAKQRRVKLTGTISGKPSIDEAALLVHGDRVYILAIDCDTPNYPPMHAAMDGILSSLRWTK